MMAKYKKNFVEDLHPILLVSIFYAEKKSKSGRTKACMGRNGDRHHMFQIGFGFSEYISKRLTTERREDLSDLLTW